MSRGRGRIQRRAVELLSVDERARKEGLPLAALVPDLGPDRSNGRRVIRSLIRRGAAEWVVDEGGTRRVKLELWTGISAVLKREGRPDDCYLDKPVSRSR